MLSAVQANHISETAGVLEFDIDHLDLVIANAAISQGYPRISEVKQADILTHFTTNVLGVVSLYQATLPLLLKSTNPKWATMGSGAGFLE
ncbi:hypothetical protein F4779DRAFT_399732 [Xylariaceae sp. FL0662B]|nr:hypothetical protein F4779DRAFT_399732 [Xylariaceae sp. FL0662B]